MSLSRQRLRNAMPAMLPIWGLRAELPARDRAQEKANPSADPTTIAVKTSGSAMTRQLLRKVSCTAGYSSERAELFRAHPDSEDKVAQPPGIGPDVDQAEA